MVRVKGGEEYMNHTNKGSNTFLISLLTFILGGLLGWVIGINQMGSTVSNGPQLGIGGAPPTAVPTMAEHIIVDWPEAQRVAAQTFISTYGQPDEMTESRLIWHNSSPWKEIHLYRDAIQDLFPIPHSGFIVQTINYNVPVDRMDEVATFDASIVIDQATGEISARSNNEAINFLALNLVDEIVKNERSVEEARDFYTAEAERIANGEFSEYTSGLRFTL